MTPEGEVTTAEETKGRILSDTVNSPEDDIFLFENNMKLFQNAIEDNNISEAEVYLKKNTEIAAIEIARAKNNLANLESGNTKYLVEWRKQNGITDSLNIDVEISHLTDNINSMKYRYKYLLSANINKLADTKTNQRWLADMKIILKNMRDNLKYDSNRKGQQIVQTPVNESMNDTSIYISEHQMNDENKNSDPIITDNNTEPATNNTQLRKVKNIFQKQLEAKEYKSAKRTYKSILKIMQSEIDANKLLKEEKDKESIKLATINVDTISPKIAAQQKILDKAEKIKIPSAPDSSFTPSETLDLITEFERTLN